MDYYSQIAWYTVLGLKINFIYLVLALGATVHILPCLKQTGLAFLCDWLLLVNRRFDHYVGGASVLTARAVRLTCNTSDSQK